MSGSSVGRCAGGFGVVIGACCIGVLLGLQLMEHTREQALVMDRSRAEQLQMLGQTPLQIRTVIPSSVTDISGVVDTIQQNDRVIAARINMLQAAIEHMQVAPNDGAGEGGFPGSAEERNAAGKKKGKGKKGKGKGNIESASSSPPPKPGKPDPPSESVLLPRVLEAIPNMNSMLNFPAWYFGAGHKKTYFETGPWAETADANITNLLCVQQRKNLWPFIHSLKPSRGRKAVVITLSRCSLCDMILYGVEGIKQSEHPIMLIGGGNENWGMFSSTVPGRTTDWGNLTNALRKRCRMTFSHVQEFLNHPNLALWVINQHQYPRAANMKAISLPLGVKGPRFVFDAMKRFRDTKKVRLLLINNSGWKHRKAINEMIAARIAGTAGNNYKTDNVDPKFFQRQMAESKFVLCPSGMGYDTYRHWETLYLGAIPVMERSPGLDRAFTKLPAVIVDSFDDVTEDLLRREYKRIVKQADEFDFKRLTPHFWMSLVDTVAREGNARIVHELLPETRGAYAVSF